MLGTATARHVGTDLRLGTIQIYLESAPGPKVLPLCKLEEVSYLLNGDISITCWDARGGGHRGKE